MTRFQDNQQLVQPPSTILAAKIFHSMRPLIEAAIDLMPQGTRPRKLMDELVLSEFQVKNTPLKNTYQNQTPMMRESQQLLLAQKALEKNGLFKNGQKNTKSDSEESDTNQAPTPQAPTVKASSGPAPKRGRPKKLKASTPPGLKRGRKPGLYTVGDESLTLSEWVERTGVGYATLLKRLKEGVPLDAPKAKVGRKPLLKSVLNETPLFGDTAGEESPDLAFMSTKASESTLEGQSPLLVPTPSRGRPPKYPPLTWRGETKSLKAWSDETGISVATIMARIGRGWTSEMTLSMAPLKRGRRGPKRIKPVLNSRTYFAPHKSEADEKPKVILRRKVDIELG